MKPLLKWVGGKRWIASDVVSIIRERWGNYKSYWEPFLGGGSVFFELAPKRAFVIDNVPQLVNFYRGIRSYPREIHVRLRRLLDEGLTEEVFHKARKRFNELHHLERWDSEFSSLFLYLNRTSYNGLWRLNSKSEFNVPWGKYDKVSVPELVELKTASRLLARTTIWNCHYNYVNLANKGDVVFVDPPYLGTYSNYDGQAESGRSAHAVELEFHLELARTLKQLRARGVHVLAMNSDEPVIQEIYSPLFEIQHFSRNQSIAGTNEGRAPFPQLLMISQD